MTERDPYHVEIKLKPGALESILRMRQEADDKAHAAAFPEFEPRRPRPKFVPFCTARPCRLRGRYEVKDKPYCWTHAKRAAGWKEEAQDGSQHR